jgi:hypothetical protein
MIKSKHYQEAISEFLDTMKKSDLSTEFIETERQEMIKRDKPASLSAQRKWLKQIGFNFKLIHNTNLFAIYYCKKG